MRIRFKYPCGCVDNIKTDLKTGLRGISLMNPSRHGPVDGCFEYGNEPSGFNRMRRMSWLAKETVSFSRKTLFQGTILVTVCIVGQCVQILPQFCCKAECLMFWTISVYTLRDNSHSVYRRMMCIVSVSSRTTARAAHCGVSALNWPISLDISCREEEHTVLSIVPQ